MADDPDEDKSMGLGILVRPAVQLDLSALWSWRESSVSAAILGQKDEVVSFDQFAESFRSALANQDNLMLIAIGKTLRIGALHFKHAGGDVYRLSLTLRQPFFARSLSSEMLAAGLSYLQRERRIVAVEATVPDINPAMDVLFRQAGFSISPSGGQLICVFRPGAVS